MMHDSVMPYTPILVRKKFNHSIQIQTIENLATCDSWLPSEGWNASASSKEYSVQPFFDYEAWTDRGWSSITKIIRHKSNKNIIRVLTSCNTMCVDVTEDHSLMSSYRIPIRPHESLIGMPLLVSLPDVKDRNNLFDIEPSLLDNVQMQWQKRFLKYCLSQGARFPFLEEPVTIGRVELLHHKWDGYVYDIQTTEGVFQAGVGCLIVKNTDDIISIL